MITDLVSFVALLALAQKRAPVAKAASCFNVAYNPNGVCNSDPKAAEYLQAVVVQDHKFPNCSDPGVFSMNARFVDLNGTTSSVNALSTTTIDSAFTGTMVFNFAVPMATIGDQSPVTLGLSASNPGATGSLSKEIKYTHRHSPTILYIVSTTASTVTASTTATSTMTVTVSDETTVTPSALKTVTKFGVETISAPDCTVWQNSTVTPRGRTIIQTKKIFTNKPASCLSTVAPLATGAKLRFKRDITYSTPYCAAPITTVIPTSTTTRQIFSTSTDTVTVLSTKTILKTVTVNAITIYQSVTSQKTAEASACKTKNAFFQQERSTNNLVKTATYTNWTYPSSVSLPPCGGSSALSVTARINNAPEPTQASSSSSQRPTSSSSLNTFRGSDGVQATIQASASVGASAGHH